MVPAVLRFIDTRGGSHKIHYVNLGSIPARAGEPSAPANHGVRQWVYPRACGGTVTSATPAGSVKGLSPRVRGNLRLLGQRQGRHRSIPARAGEPRLPCAVLHSRAVYPRACGGTRRQIFTHHRRPGLSPRVRGNPHALPAAYPFAGSIPARAGEPPPTRRTAAASRVYPRACGGTSIAMGPRLSRFGLSPRVRGNPEKPPASPALVRSIPARAGNHAGRVPSRWRKRSIPARAGEPRRSCYTYSSVRVYPRACGGTHILARHAPEG